MHIADLNYHSVNFLTSEIVITVVGRQLEK